MKHVHLSTTSIFTITFLVLSTVDKALLSIQVLESSQLILKLRSHNPFFFCIQFTLLSGLSVYSGNRVERKEK